MPWQLHALAAVECRVFDVRIPSIDMAMKCEQGCHNACMFNAVSTITADRSMKSSASSVARRARPKNSVLFG
eukprot:CAMPEP_0181486846 /NCGR_PEP_ID=MMETSP1110-20121109/47457_1 /TAXON_ID=174948 /ORGANISM="Symbiodinium sp., Strain CCMP421" /LENGTH=71 /DNA_ID=CAMNT_0023613221 /DNA_START=135 /DNA_END=347 /DNA_ORIENTATION=+